MQQTKIKKAPEGAIRGRPSVLPYNLHYPDDWVRLFKDTRDMAVERREGCCRSVDSVQRDQFIADAFEKIVKGDLVQPDNRDYWKRGTAGNNASYGDWSEDYE